MKTGDGTVNNKDIKSGQNEKEEKTSINIRSEIGGKKGIGRYLTGGLLLLFLVFFMAFCSFGTYTRDALLKFLTVSKDGRDMTLTRMDSKEVEELKPYMDLKMGDNLSTKVKQNQQGVYKLEFSEKEILYVILTGAGFTDNYSEVGLELKENYMRLEVGAEALANQLNKDLGEDQQIDTSRIKDLYLSIELSVDSSGKRLIVNKVSTGNFVLDRFIPKEVNRQIEEDMNQTMSKDDAKYVRLENMRFREDGVEMTYILKEGVSVDKIGRE